ncbi:hypothetical protein V8G54_014336 [Vigna mungo]|uniref:WAT1-related protein n=1 Tax=Vigna mungo TaxID=3915 RepID=A0AAQ3NHC6_VIGMU
MLLLKLLGVLLFLHAPRGRHLGLSLGPTEFTGTESTNLDGVFLLPSDVKSSVVFAVRPSDRSSFSLHVLRSSPRRGVVPVMETLCSQQVDAWNGESVKLDQILPFKGKKLFAGARLDYSNSVPHRLAMVGMDTTIMKVGWFKYVMNRRFTKRGKCRGIITKSKNPFDFLEEKMSRGTIEDVAIIGGLVGVQFIYAGNAVFMGYALSLGFSSLTIIILTSLATFLVLFPVSFFFERSKWPKNCDFKLIKQLLCLSFGGLLFQYLFLKGLDLTSPAMGTAMPNIAPGLIFIIAWISG